MQVLQGDYSNLKCFVTLTTVTIYSRFDVKVENTQQLPSEIPLASFFVVLQGKNHRNIYFFTKKMKNNNKQTECPLSCPWCTDSRSQTVEDIYVTQWHPKKTQKDILVNALAISLRQYCDYVCHISAPIYFICKWRCKKLNCAATEIPLRFYCALIRTQSHDPYFEHANSTVRQLSVWI